MLTCKRCLLPALLASVASCLSTSSSSGLLLRWAEAPHHDLELSNSELTTYIATGRLPESALAQLTEHASLAQVDESNDGKPIPAKFTKEDAKYLAKGNKAVKEMQEYKQKLDMVRNKAEAAYYKVKKQEDRLSANFIPVSKLLSSLVQTASDAAAKAEVRTMMNRLNRMHYKQVAALDRSATYWSEVAEREAEARRVAEAKVKVHTQKIGLSGDEVKQLFAVQQARNQDQAEMNAWFENYWSQLAENEKKALENGTPFEANEKKEILSMLEKFGSTKHLETTIDGAPEQK